MNPRVFRVAIAALAVVAVGCGAVADRETALRESQGSAGRDAEERAETRDPGVVSRAVDASTVDDEGRAADPGSTPPATDAPTAPSAQAPAGTPGLPIPMLAQTAEQLAGITTPSEELLEFWAANWPEGSWCWNARTLIENWVDPSGPYPIPEPEYGLVGAQERMHTMSDMLAVLAALPPEAVQVAASTLLPANTAFVASFDAAPTWNDAALILVDFVQTNLEPIDTLLLSFIAGCDQIFGPGVTAETYVSPLTPPA